MKRLIASFQSDKFLKEIVWLLKAGKIIIFPTDTVYGLIGLINRKETIERIFQIKKRNFQKPLPVFVKDIEMAKDLAFINKEQERFLKKVWPGKVTVILRAKKDFPKGILSSEGKIGLRIPNYRPLNKILKRVNFPLSATSANISGKPASSKIKEIIEQFKNKKFKPDFFVDAGKLNSSRPSTVLDLANGSLKILRKGPIKKKDLLKYFN